MTTKAPVYFISHGGPNIMFDCDHPAHKRLKEMGREITSKILPKAVVVFSAHWQAGKNHVEVNTQEAGDLIYDYYGFPSQYYKVKYPHTGSNGLASRIISLLQKNHIDARPTNRGLDHGVFAPFTCMFPPDENPLGAPIVQVSLYGSEDADKHFELGAALQELRSDGILIISSGMAVHNLRDFRRAMVMNQEMPYAKTFDTALRAAIVNPSGSIGRKAALRELLQREDARSAHPTFEHLLPIHIAAGAAGEDEGRQGFTKTELSLSWAQYVFGDQQIRC